MNVFYKFKNLKLRYKQKFHRPFLFQTERASNMVFNHPLKTFKQFILKVLIGLTYRCQCKCIYCGCGKYPLLKENELTNKEILEVIKQIADIPTISTVISFFGGEALLRDDIYEFINFANKKGLFTELESNGLLLNLENVKKLKTLGLHHSFIRIESSKPEIHDALSNYKGCFKKAIEGVEMLQAKFSLLQFSTPSIAFLKQPL